MSGSLSPEEFESALSAYIAERLMPRIREIYLDAATQLHEAIALETPVDTGYLRASLTAAAGDDAPDAMPPRDAKGSYSPGDGDAAAAAAIVRAVAEMESLTIGFTAEYAPHVEDHAHMVKIARGRWGQIMETAIRNQNRG